eukprot:gene28296-37227_t
MNAIIFQAFLLLLLSVIFCKSSLQLTEAERHWFSARLGLLKSTWPSDHGDTSRSKFTLNAGLNFSINNAESEIQIDTKEDLKLSQWIYTAGDNSEYLYIIGGPNPTSLFVAKADAVSLEVLQKISLPPGLYIGGLLMHRNGHVYCVHSNRLLRFWNGDLYNSTTIIIPYKTMNHRLIQTNGMLVTQDGYLLIKQWNLIPDDLSLMASNVLFVRLSYLFTILSTVISFYILHKRWAWAPSAIAAPLFGYAIGRVVMLAFWMLFFFLVLGSYNPIMYLSSFHSLDPLAGRGEVKFIDPLTLEVVAEVVSAERFSYARMAVVALQNSDGEDEDAIILLGDENVYQYRWRPRTKEVFLIPGWTRKYRTYGEGTFPGTGPSIYQNVAYFTDNTFPVELFGPTYTIFAAPITTIDSGSQTSNSDRPITVTDYQPVSELTAEQQGLVPVWVRAFAPPPKQYPWVKISQPVVDANSSSPGFMYWSVVINPLEDSVIVWNSAGHSVQCRRLSDLVLKWEIRNIKQADCISVAADKGHVYMTDYSDGPTVASEWLKASSHTTFKNVNKFFIIANSSTGEIIANKTISEGAGMSVSVVIGGANNDVFVGTREALVRLYM